jgi:hypothetical protein
MLPSKLRRAPAVIVTGVVGIVSLAFLCEAPRIVLGRTDVQIVRVIVVSLEEIAVDLRLDLKDVQVCHVSVFVIHTGFI